jgi:hypothetical protein
MTDNTTTTSQTFLPKGTLVRLTRDLIDLNGADLRAGLEFSVEEFVTAGDPAQEEIDIDFYAGSAYGGYSNINVPADAVEVVRTAEQQQSRVLPSRTQLSDFVGKALLDEHLDLYMDETSVDAALHQVEVYGHTSEGLGFGFRVKVLDVWRTDD